MDFGTGKGSAWPIRPIPTTASCGTHAAVKWWRVTADRVCAVRAGVMAVWRRFAGNEPVPVARLVARRRGRRGEPEYGSRVGIGGRRGRVTVRRRRCTPAAASARGGGSGMAEWRRQGAGVVSDSATKLGAE